MSSTLHKFYIGSMALVVVLTTIYLGWTGYEFYQLPSEERFYHPHYDWFKPSGAFGHGLGIVGTLMILFGVVLYIARKKYGFLEHLIRIKYLLEFHIFLCTLGPVLVLFHTSFKFNGIVSIAFWSMVAVVASGVVGRFIYVRIPRNIQGQEIGLEQLNLLHQNLKLELESFGLLRKDELESVLGLKNQTGASLAEAKKLLQSKEIDKADQVKIFKLLKEEKKLTSRIKNLNRMQELFKYWHVAHKPFALIMLVIVVIHVIVTLALGYKWIF